MTFTLISTVSRDTIREQEKLTEPLHEVEHSYDVSGFSAPMRDDSALVNVRLFVDSGLGVAQNGAAGR